MSEGTIEPAPEQLERLAASTDPEPVVMLNLLRFREEAGGIHAGDELSGAEAYARYGAAVTGHLTRVGARVLFAGAPQELVIGPEAEGSWDMVLAVRYPSRKAFLEMIADPGYQQIHDHRGAALADSRLIACAELPTPADG